MVSHAVATTPTCWPPTTSSRCSRQLERARGRRRTSRCSTGRSRRRYPPGSTFKLVTAAAALEQRLLRRHDLVKGGPTCSTCPDHGPTCATRTAGATAAATQITFTQALASLLQRRFRLTSASSSARERCRRRPRSSASTSDIPRRAAAAGRVSASPATSTEPQTACPAIGQFDVAATPLQMAMVAAGIANGGDVMRPYVVDEVRSPDLEVLDEAEPEVLHQGGRRRRGRRADPDDGRRGRDRHGDATRRSPASRWPARPAPPEPAETGRRTPGSSRSHRPTTRRWRWRCSSSRPRRPAAT